MLVAAFTAFFFLNDSFLPFFIAVEEVPIQDYEIPLSKAEIIEQGDLFKLFLVLRHITGCSKKYAGVKIINYETYHEFCYYIICH